MKKRGFYIFIVIWLCILTVFAFVFSINKAQIKAMEEKQLIQEEIMLKQAEILAVNTTLLQAVFRSIHSSDDSSSVISSYDAHYSKKRDRKPNCNLTD